MASRPARLYFPIPEFLVSKSPGEPTVSDEPEYLKALKRRQERQKEQSRSSTPAAAPTSQTTPAEREAAKWAREVGGRDLRVASSFSGARVAILVQPITPFGSPPVTLEGLPNREALAERIMAAQGAGENVLGCYEITTGRPLTHEIKDGQVSLTPGKPREMIKAESPDRMIRRAAKEAEMLAKTRKVDDRGGPGGGRGRGGR
jgi:hypothetical protein